MPKCFLIFTASSCVWESPLPSACICENRLGNATVNHRYQWHTISKIFFSVLLHVHHRTLLHDHSRNLADGVGFNCCYPGPFYSSRYRFMSSSARGCIISSFPICLPPNDFSNLIALAFHVPWGYVIKSESVSCSVTSDSLQPLQCSLSGASVHRILRQKYWSGLPFPSPGDLPNPGIEPCLLHCRQILYQLSHQRCIQTQKISIIKKWPEPIQVP